MPDPFTNARLAKFAHGVLVAHLLGQPQPSDAECPSIDHHGLFVTIRTSGALRGCIGTFKSGESLARTLGRVVIESAQDSRFMGMPLCAKDIPSLRLDISLLSALQSIHDSSRIETGRHGIVIEHGNHRGCFLPEVATEHGWDALTLLRQCCTQKMELPSDTWQDSQSRLFTFTVEKIEA